MLNNNLKYEFEETECGFWLGNKKYRKVFKCMTPNITSGSVIIDDTGIGVVVKTEGYLVTNDGLRIPNGFYNGSSYFSFFYNPNSHALEFRISNEYKLLNTLITLEYIK